MTDRESYIAAARVALVGWYRRHADAPLLERVRWWGRRADIPDPKVLVRDQQQQLGSCSLGVVRFNWRILHASMRLVDYVVVHELIHLLRCSHDRAYWQALGRAMPDCDGRKADLRRMGEINVVTMVALLPPIAAPSWAAP